MFFPSDTSSNQFKPEMMRPYRPNNFFSALGKSFNSGYRFIFPFHQSVRKHTNEIRYISVNTSLFRNKISNLSAIITKVIGEKKSYANF